jgi:hypothetical protein
MLDEYFVKPGTIERVRSSWIGAEIETYLGARRPGREPVEQFLGLLVTGFGGPAGRITVPRSSRRSRGSSST